MKKKWLWIVIIILAVAAMVFGTMLWFVNKKSLSMSVGRVLITQNGTYMLIDGNSPIVMSNRLKNDKLFEGLENGDKIWVLHDGIQETYPARTGAYAVRKLEDGSVDDIPKGVLDALRELGWVSQGESEVSKSDGVETDAGSQEDAEETNRVSVSHGERILSINIPEGWEHDIREYSDEYSGFGINFWPKGETEGKLSFLYYDAWGVCGTGLKSEKIEIGGYEASQGNYDGGIWEFISFRKEPGWCVIQHSGTNTYTWLKKRMDEAMEIIDTIRVE